MSAQTHDVPLGAAAVLRNQDSLILNPYGSNRIFIRHFQGERQVEVGVEGGDVSRTVTFIPIRGIIHTVMEGLALATDWGILSFATWGNHIVLSARGRSLYRVSNPGVVNFLLEVRFPLEELPRPLFDIQYAHGAYEVRADQLKGIYVAKSAIQTIEFMTSHLIKLGILF